MLIETARVGIALKRPKLKLLRVEVLGLLQQKPADSRPLSGGMDVQLIDPPRPLSQDADEFIIDDGAAEFRPRRGDEICW
nr:hypothetical protein [Arthrobacter sp. H14]